MSTKQNQFFPQIAFHPGETLADKLNELGMGPKEFAIRSGKPEKTIIGVMKGESSITPEMAVQFEQVLQIPANFWLKKQRYFDEFLARRAHQKKIDACSTWTKKFPLNEMIKKGWISDKSSIAEKTNELLAFFGVSHHLAWENYYLNQELKVVFRISLAHTKEPYAISAWLRKGELQAAELPDTPYSEKKFIASLPALKSLMAQHPEDFFLQLQQICLEAGVKVVNTPCLTKAPIHGCTRWIKDNPLIQLTASYKRNDIFWFTFFHEAGHIILHGKKDVFLENIEYSDIDNLKEQEADEFAIKWTLIKEQEKQLDLPS